jgi:hypothetical protein
MPIRITLIQKGIVRRMNARKDSILHIPGTTTAPTTSHRVVSLKTEMSNKPAY